jgi:DNA-binding NarL/FixJ family response regulator
MSKTRKIRLLIVDDHPVVRMGLRQVEDLDSAIEVVGEAASGADALAQSRKLVPDVVLLDYRLPDIPGHEVCHRLKTELPSVRVLFLSSYALESSTVAALDAGGDGYLLKENDAQKIVDAVRTVHAGGMVIDPAIARATVARARQPAAGAPGILERLSEQERRVLAEVAKGKTDKEIAQALNLQSKTVRNYLVQVYRKLEVHTRTQAALAFQEATRQNPA